MKANTYLQRAVFLKKLIDDCDEKILEIRTVMESAGAIRYDKLNVQVTPEDPILANIARLDALITKANMLRLEYYGLFFEIQHRINTIENPLQRDILRLRYLECMPFDQISEELGYSLDYVYSVHSQALRNFEKRYF